MNKPMTSRHALRVALALIAVVGLMATPFCALASDTPIDINDVQRILDYPRPTAPKFDGKLPVYEIPAFSTTRPIDTKGDAIPGLVDGYSEVYVKVGKDEIVEYCQKMSALGFRLYDAAQYTKDVAPIAFGLVNGPAKIIVLYDADIGNAYVYYDKAAQYTIILEPSSDNQPKTQGDPSGGSPLSITDGEPLADEMLFAADGLTQVLRLRLMETATQDGWVYVKFGGLPTGQTVRFGIRMDSVPGAYEFGGALGGAISATWPYQSTASEFTSGNETASDERSGFVFSYNNYDTSIENEWLADDDGSPHFSLKLEAASDGHYAGTLSGRMPADIGEPATPFEARFAFAAGNP